MKKAELRSASISCQSRF